MTTTYRAAVIGLGRMGSTFDDEMKMGSSIVVPYCHTPAYVNSPRTDLVAGADPHDEQRSIYAERWGVEGHVYADYRQMLEKERPDVVSVSTSARLRAQIVEDVATSGAKAIWAEKPLALSLEETDRMLAVCERNSVKIAVNCARRYHPVFQTARELIEAGSIGELLQVTAYSSCYLSHNGSHAIDTMRYLVGGHVEWVFGEMVSDEAAALDDDLQGNGYMAFDNGVRGFLRAMETGPAASWEFDVLGTEGRVRILFSGNDWEQWTVSADGDPARVAMKMPPRVQGMGLTIVDDLLTAVEEDGKPRCSGGDARQALEIAIALRESHRGGGTKVKLPLEDRSLRILSGEIAGDHTPARIRRLQAQQG